jgi:hypothetical protein
MMKIKKLKIIVLKKASNQYNSQEKECQGVDFCNQAPLNQQIIGKHNEASALLTKISKLHHPQLHHHQYTAI